MDVVKLKDQFDAKLKDQFDALQQPLRDAVHYLLDFAREALPEIQDMANPIYGTFHGGDPRNFTPDPECSTEQERRRHEAACELWTKWEAGELTEVPESNPDCSTVRDDDGKIVLILTKSQFGLGTNCDAKMQELCYHVQIALLDLIGWKRTR